MATFGEKEMTFFMKQFKGRCWHCGKVGHKAENCWSLESNKGKRPPSWNQVSSQQNNNNNKNQEGRKSKKNVIIMANLDTSNVFAIKRKEIKKENANVSQEGNNEMDEVGFM